MRSWPAFLLAIAACGGAGTDPHLEQDIAAIRVGVDPRAETREVVAGLGRAGLEVVARVEGEGFVALGARDESGRTAIRVVTSRGIVGDVDVDDPTAPVSLVATPSLDRDLDGDGRPELVFSTVEPARGRTCLSLARVERDGSLLAVPVELGPLGEGSCVESVADVGGDARAELIAVVREPALARGAPPTVRVPLVVRGSGYAPAPPASYRAFWDRERSARREAVASARVAHDLETAYRFAVELAAIARETGGLVVAQTVAFDEALRGLVLTEEMARTVAAARAAIGRGWTLE